ncbi:MAG: electron transfer flavoprotein subunit alpha/FixB family protein [Candidatus Delongbacteria bacterium]|nr:electron transfer flavoprotein subunit alpha/FixB family protein [Candidatus Delongbacteria bacterium]MBN2834828.1 electron transfer flavoprotein subunit alpha/FixB family protein [Candidatus Delongbacteria bacterium]
MNSVFVYCELEENGISDVSLELLSKGRKLANELKVSLETIVIGAKLKDIGNQLFPYGVDVVHTADDSRLFPYTTIPHTKIVCEVVKKEQPQIFLVGATSVGRDLAPRVASTLQVGLTADCTNLVIGQYEDKKKGKVHENLLYQIRPAFGGNIIATIVNPDTRPQMATVREGVMKKEIYNETYKGKVKNVDVTKIISQDDFVVKIIDRVIEERKVNLTGAQIIVSGGFGVGSKDNFKLLYDLAELIGGEVGATRAAVDAGFSTHDRQIGQTGVTVRPKLYIACGISGAVQHRAGMDGSSQIISINNDPEAPINKIADYTIIGDVSSIITKMIKYYKEESK